jgi:hypothetical protein
VTIARLLALGLVTGLAGACASIDPSAPASPPLASAPAPVAGQDWFYHVDGGEARLAYGVEASDDLRLGLSCARGAGRLELSTHTQRAASDIHLESGGETERFPARSEPSELDDGVFLTAEAATAVPVFQRFRRVGWLAQWQDGARQVYAPHPVSAGDIERFFAFCG